MRLNEISNPSDDIMAKHIYNGRMVGRIIGDATIENLHGTWKYTNSPHMVSYLFTMVFPFRDAYKIKADGLLDYRYLEGSSECHDWTVNNLSVSIALNGSDDYRYVSSSLPHLSNSYTDAIAGVKDIIKQAKDKALKTTDRLSPTKIATLHEERMDAKNLKASDNIQDGLMDGKTVNGCIFRKPDEENLYGYYHFTIDQPAVLIHGLLLYDLDYDSGEHYWDVENLDWQPKNKHGHPGFDRAVYNVSIGTQGQEWFPTLVELVENIKKKIRAESKLEVT